MVIMNKEGGIHVTRKTHKTLTIILLIALAFSANVLLEVQAPSSSSFTATISPTEVYVNQQITYSVTITPTGNKTLGSAAITIPAGFSEPASIMILAPSSTWSYTLSSGAIDLTGIDTGRINTTRRQPHIHLRRDIFLCPWHN